MADPTSFGEVTYFDAAKGYVELVRRTFHRGVAFGRRPLWKV